MLDFSCAKVFKNHVNVLRKKDGQKRHAFARIANYVDVEKHRVMMSAFVVSQVSYCPSVWKLHDRSVNKKINKIHERALRIACEGGCSHFEELLTKANTVSIHHKNLQLLATEIFKTQRNFNPSFMNQIFVEKIRSGRDIFSTFQENIEFMNLCDVVPSTSPSLFLLHSSGLRFRNLTMSHTQ